MSNLMPSPDALECRSDAAPEPSREAYPGRWGDLGGGLIVRRAMPHRERRLVGPWCFLDYFGPLVFDAGQPIRPGQLNLMAAGRGIAHSEETPPRHSRALHGLQLWVALPDAHRHAAPAFHHYGKLPMMTLGTGRAMVVIGDFAGVRSPAQTCSRMVGVELAADRDGRTDVPLAPSFEHAIMLIDGHVGLDDRVLAPDTLYYLDTGREQLSLELRAGARLMLLGGEPFSERVLMWWTSWRALPRRSRRRAATGNKATGGSAMYVPTSAAAFPRHL